MRKWKQVMVAASAVAMMGVVAGCASKEAETTNAPVETTIEAVEPDTAEDDITAKDPGTIDERELVSENFPYGNPVVDIPRMFEDMGSLLGEDDDKTVFLLGDGIVNKEEDDTVSSRQYTMKVLDSSTTTDVLYNEGKVVEIQMVLDEADLESCKKQLDESLKLEGALKKTKNDGSDMQSYVWELSDCTVELLESYYTVSIKITGNTP